MRPCGWSVAREGSAAVGDDECRSAGGGEHRASPQRASASAQRMRMLHDGPGPRVASRFPASAPECARSARRSTMNMTHRVLWGFVLGIGAIQLLACSGADPQDPNTQTETPAVAQPGGEQQAVTEGAAPAEGQTGQ